MKILYTLCLSLTIWILATTYGNSQENPETTNSEIQDLHSVKEKIIQEEKEALKKAVENIESRLQAQAITETEAEALKKAAAEKHALNIENRFAIASNQSELIKRNGADSTSGYGTRIILGIGQVDIDNDFIFGIKVQNKNKDKKRKYDRRTTTGFVFAFGLNNAITEGKSLDDSDFKIGGSRFAELGWSWKTRVFKNSNWLRIKYGVSFQFNGLKPIDNQFYVDTGEQTELQVHPLELKKSKFRMDNLVAPIHFEFGPSKKTEGENYFRYSTKKQFVFGLGGYAGVNLGARQKLKYRADGERQKQKIKADYNTNNFIYGLSAYVGWGGTSLYAKYDLNPIFKNNAVDQRNVSLGLRLDFD